jgi:hypothetical protein
MDDIADVTSLKTLLVLPHTKEVVKPAITPFVQSIVDFAA